MNYESFISYRYFRSKRKNGAISFMTFISVIGVSIGVMSVIVGISLMNGFERDMKYALIGANSHLTLYPSLFNSQGIENYEDVIQTIEATIPTTSVVPFTEHQGLLMATGKPSGVLIRGILPEKEEKTHLTTKSIFLQNPLLFNDQVSPATPSEVKEILKQLQPQVELITYDEGKQRKEKIPGILLGSDLALELNVTRGDFVRFISPEERVSPFGNLPRAKKFKVIGFYESGLSGYDKVLSFVHIQESQKIFRMKDAISGLSINISNPEDAKLFQDQLQQVFAFSFHIRSWIQDNENLFAVMKLEKFILAIVLFLIILVSSFNIISSLILLVVEKRKDIAILKSMGATNASIRKIFLIQGSIIGLIGTITGEVLGIVVCLLLTKYQILEIPPKVYPGKGIPIALDPLQLFIIGFSAFLICFLVTIYPSQKAALTDPIEGLRYE